jgi:hypothetical protein
MIQRYKIVYINSKPEFIPIEEEDSVITLKEGELRGFTFEESTKYYGKVKQLAVYTYLSDDQMKDLTYVPKPTLLMRLWFKLKMWIKQHLKL